MNHTINTKTKEGYMASIPSGELVSSQKDLTNGGYKLLMYYYSKGNHWDWKDDVICKDMDISDRMLKEYRNELVKKDYLLIVKGQINNVFIGRLAVAKIKNPPKDEEEE